MSKLKLAEDLYELCKEKRMDYKGAPRYIERKIEKESEEVQYAIELYVRYNLYDRRLRDDDMDFAKEILKTAN